jgi:hypothetical protein
MKCNCNYIVIYGPKLEWIVIISLLLVLVVVLVLEKRKFLTRMFNTHSTRRRPISRRGRFQASFRLGEAELLTPGSFNVPEFLQPTENIGVFWGF